MSEKLLRASFVKDSVYGTLTVVVFFALGWTQAYTACAHALSAVCMVVLALKSDLPKFSSWLFVSCSVITVIADAATIVLTTCSLKSCCAPGSLSPSFLPYVEVPDICAGSSRRVDTQVIATTAAITVAIGILTGIERIRICVGEKGVIWVTPFVAYTAIRIFVATFTWSSLNIIVPIMAALLPFAFAIACIFFYRREARKDRKTHLGEIAATVLIFVTLVCDVVALSLVFTGVNKKEEVVAPFATFQAISIMIDVWMLFTVRADIREAAPQEVEELGTVPAPASKASEFNLVHRRQRTMMI